MTVTSAHACVDVPSQRVSFGGVAPAMPAAPSALLLLLLCLSTSAACVAALSQAAARGEGQGGVGHRRAALSEAAAADRPRGGLLLTWGVGGPERLGRHGDTALPLPLGHGAADVSFLQVAAGGHTCAVASGSMPAVWCWGRNSSDGGGGHGSPPVPDSGQLGHGGPGNGPGQVVGEVRSFGATSVAVGRYHSAAAAGGKVFTWGLNDQGQLGRGATMAPQPGPEPCFSGAACRSGSSQAVGGLLTGENVTGVAAGRYSTYAITASGALFSFGLDACSNGGVVPPVADAHLPRRVALQSAVVAISVGYVHWAALTSDGAVFTCDTGDDGYAGTLANKRAPNADGELGRELGIGAHLPGQVTGLLAGKRIVSVAAGRSHTLAVDADGRLYGWGNNQAGQLGIEAGHSAAVPALVSAPPLDTSPVSAVAAGEYFSLAALAGGGLLGWGANGNGQLGRGIDASPEERHVAPAHLGAAGQPPLHVMSLAAGYQHAAAVVAVAPASGTQKGAASVNSSSPVTLMPASGSLDGIPGPAAPPADIWAAHRAALPPRHADIVAASPDVFAMLPTDTPPLLPGIASPCWHAAAEALGAHTDVRCLPLIHVLGVSKCGTTDLYKRLAKHPDFVDSLNKGPHFWDESPPGPAGQFASYVALFDELARRVGSGANATPPSPAARLVSCDASSNTYTASGVYRRGHTPEGDVTVGELLLDAVPYGRFILMLRNPTDRLLSAFHYYRRMFGPRDQKPATAADFQAHVAESLGAWGTCLAAHAGNVTPCVRRFEPQQLIKGMYSEFLWDWAPRLRPDQLLVLRLEDYSVDLKRHLEAVFRFTGLRQPTETEWVDILSAPAANVGARRAVLQGRALLRGNSMLPETRATLDDFYAPFNRRLADALGDQRFTWA